MGRVVILLIISLLSYHPAIVQGVKQFVLNFQQSSNKVIVSDLYYGLEYSIWRGTQEANEFVESAQCCCSIYCWIRWFSLVWLQLFLCVFHPPTLLLSACSRPTHTDGEKIQSVSVGTGPGGFIRSRSTSRGFVLYGRGDEIEFAREIDVAAYSQFSVERKNIRLVERRPTHNIFSHSSSRANKQALVIDGHRYRSRYIRRVNTHTFPPHPLSP